jgi:hypothetical protein
MSEDRSSFIGFSFALGMLSQEASIIALKERAEMKMIEFFGKIEGNRNCFTERFHAQPTGRMRLVWEAE